MALRGRTPRLRCFLQVIVIVITCPLGPGCCCRGPCGKQGLVQTGRQVLCSGRLLLAPATLPAPTVPPPRPGPWWPTTPAPAPTPTPRVRPRLSDVCEGPWPQPHSPAAREQQGRHVGPGLLDPKAPASHLCIRPVEMRWGWGTLLRRGHGLSSAFDPLWLKTEPDQNADCSTEAPGLGARRAPRRPPSWQVTGRGQFCCARVPGARTEFGQPRSSVTSHGREAVGASDTCLP